MTKSQIWVAAFLVTFLILFFLVHLTKEDESTGPTENPMPQTNITSNELSAADLITRLGCKSCHGTDLTGSKMGPDLTNASEFWNRDELINYLRNPNSYMEKDRFRKFRDEYPGILMPSFGNVEVKDLGRIAEYLLSL